MSVKRNPDKTRAKILSAALHEFAAKGFAGARVDAIARRARSNKRMLYHYFGDKKGLFEETVKAILDEKQKLMDAAPLSIEEVFPYLLESMSNRREWTRMMQWEALAYGEHEVLAEKERRAGLERGIERVLRLQREDGVLSDQRPELVLIAFMALASYPWLMPQVTRMISGRAPSDPEFRRAYGEVLCAIGRALRSSEERASA